MSLFKRLFGKEKSDPQLDDLEALVKPMIAEAVKLNVKKVKNEPRDSNLKSQFGGMPYLESEGDWPKMKSGKRLDFVCQIFNDGSLPMPEEIKLLQFFYDFGEFAWSTDDEGWKLRVLTEFDSKKAIVVQKPETESPTKYCEISFERVKSLPDWDGVTSISDKISNLCAQINDDPWEAYRQVTTKLVEDTDYRSQIGGYPKWIQSEATPMYQDGRAMPFLLQIDSEDEAGIMWGDSGMLYFFYHSEDGSVNFELQCC